MFVPKNIELNDSVTFYNNRGYSLVFSYFSGIEKEEQTCDDERECWTCFTAQYRNKRNQQPMSHILYYDGNNSNQINVRICFHAIVPDFEETYSFHYNPKNNPVTASTKIEDSVLVNGVYYKDVVILNTHNILPVMYI